MAYPSYRRSRPRRGTNHPKVFFILIVAVALFFAGLVWFRHQAKQVHEAEDMTGSNVVSLAETTEAPVRRDREEATLYNVDHVGLAVASREIQDHVFQHTVVAHLSPPGDGFHYEGWLLRNEPFDFFDTGTMDENADGTYALVWAGPFNKDFKDYTEVVVTIERDGDTGPNLHVLEGEF